MPPPWLTAEFPLRVLLMIVSVSVFQMPPPTPSKETPAELPLRVLLVIVTVPAYR